MDFTLLPNSKAISFSELPRTAQKAYLQRYVIECECIEGFDYSEVEKFTDNGEGGWLSFIVEATPLLANQRFRYGLCAAEDIKQRIMTIEPEISKSYATFQAYADWYCAGPLPEHSDSDRWPCMASGDDLVLEDGWHRFHAYVKAGHSTIPILEFA